MKLDDMKLTHEEKALAERLQEQESTTVTIAEQEIPALRALIKKLLDAHKQASAPGSVVEKASSVALTLGKAPLETLDLEFAVLARWLSHAAEQNLPWPEVHDEVSRFLTRFSAFKSKYVWSMSGSIFKSEVSGWLVWLKRSSGRRFSCKTERI